MSDFNLAIPFVFRHEGGYVCDPHDPGGETNFGICKRSYPDLDIPHLTRPEAQAIYQRDFWHPLQLDQFVSQDVATKVLDTAVLIGRHRAIRFLQQAAQTAAAANIDADGTIGPNTLAAVNQASPPLLLSAYRQLLAVYYEGLAQAVPTDRKFLNGWLTRANS